MRQGLSKRVGRVNGEGNGMRTEAFDTLSLGRPLAYDRLLRRGCVSLQRVSSPLVLLPLILGW
jgi:hypothetical protein